MPELNILYEDNHLIAVNKAAGDIAQGDITGDVSLAERVKLYIKDRYSKPGDVFLGVIHRLDRPVSGAILFARTSKAAARMQKIFAERAVEKIYLAVVEGIAPNYEGRLTHYLVRNSQKNISIAHDKEVPNSQKAVLEFRTLAYEKPFSLLEIKLLTGRHHQIRSQLSKAGCPIVGDLKYGAKIKTNGRAIALHARSIGFIHPVKKEKVFVKADFPDEEWWKEWKGYGK